MVYLSNHGLSLWCYREVTSRRLGLRGRREPLHAIHRETARALSAHIRRSAAGVHDAAVDDAREYEELGAFSSA